MAKRMGAKKPFSNKNVNDVPDQSGAVVEGMFKK